MIQPELLSLSPHAGRVWRVVENQEQAATRAITGSAGEQSRLEALLEANKPPYLEGTESLHWLLKTPFRYPPLAHGSRFGSADSPGILYAAERRKTAMVEAATYLWLFRAGPVDTGGLSVMRDGRTLLRFEYSAESAADLARDDVGPQVERICDPGSYTHSQRLGTELRRAGAEVIRYPSARQPGGVNVGVIAPHVLSMAKQPRQEHWRFQLDHARCWWGRSDGSSFEIRHQDLVDHSGRIPHPAL